MLCRIFPARLYRRLAGRLIKCLFKNYVSRHVCSSRSASESLSHYDEHIRYRIRANSLGNGADTDAVSSRRELKACRLYLLAVLLYRLYLLGGHHYLKRKHKHLRGGRCASHSRFKLLEDYPFVSRVLVYKQHRVAALNYNVSVERFTDNSVAERLCDCLGYCFPRSGNDRRCRLGACLRGLCLFYHRLCLFFSDGS